MNAWIMIALMALTTYLIRMIPFVFMRKKIRSRFLYSLFRYMPYAVLSAMVFPAMLFVSDNMLASAAAIVLCLILSLLDFPMFVVALAGAVALLLEPLLR